MDKVEEVVEEFIEKWRHESNIGVTLKELIEKHGKLKTVGELFDAEMRADLQEIVEAVRKKLTGVNSVGKMTLTYMAFNFT